MMISVFIEDALILAAFENKIKHLVKKNLDRVVCVK